MDFTPIMYTCEYTVQSPGVCSEICFKKNSDRCGLTLSLPLKSSSPPDVEILWIGMCIALGQFPKVGSSTPFPPPPPKVLVLQLEWGGANSLNFLIDQAEYSSHTLLSFPAYTDDDLWLEQGGEWSTPSHVGLLQKLRMLYQVLQLALYQSSR